MSDSTPPLTRDERMWCGARDDCTFEMIMGMAVFGATGGNPSGSRPNFFGRQHLTFDKGGKCIGNFRGIVRFGKGWCGRKAWCAFKRVVGVTVFGATGGNPSGSRPNFFGRQHLTFDKGGKNLVRS